MKNLFFIIFFIFLLIVPQTNAQGRTGNDDNPATRGAVKDQALERLRTRAVDAADKRIESLQRLLQRATNDKNLSETDKSELTKQITDVINAITALKTKIQADVSLEEIREDAKKIRDDYKVYMIFEPKIRLLIAIENLQNLSDKIAGLLPKIQALIDAEKTKGTDTSELQNLLNDINNMLKEIDTTLAANKEKVSAVTPQTGDAKTVFRSVRNELAEVRANFAKIRSDIAKMRSDFKINIKNSTVLPKSSPNP